MFFRRFGEGSGASPRPPPQPPLTLPLPDFQQNKMAKKITAEQKNEEAKKINAEQKNEDFSYCSNHAPLFGDDCEECGNPSQEYYDYFCLTNTIMEPWMSVNDYIKQIEKDLKAAKILREAALLREAPLREARDKCAVPQKRMRVGYDCEGDE